MKKLKELLQKFFKKEQKNTPVTNWATRVDNWLADFPNN